MNGHSLTTAAACSFLPSLSAPTSMSTESSSKRSKSLANTALGATLLQALVGASGTAHCCHLHFLAAFAGMCLQYARLPGDRNPQAAERNPEARTRQPCGLRNAMPCQRCQSQGEARDRQNRHEFIARLTRPQVRGTRQSTRQPGQNHPL